MTARKWAFLFTSTLLIGGVAGLLIGFGMVVFQTAPEAIVGIELLFAVIGNLGAGLMFSLISQMGFFAYQFINQYMLGLLKRGWLWQIFQIILIVVTLIDLVWLRYAAFTQPQQTWVDFLDVPLVLLAFGAVVAVVKSFLTDKSAFVPTLFVMVVVTVIEWLPALVLNNPRSMLIMLVPLILCNLWQVLILQRLLGDDEEKPAVAQT